MESTIISRNLREIREERKLSKADVAKKIRTTRSNITRWEKNTLPSVKYLIRLADLYSVSTDRLIFGKHDGSDPLAEERAEAPIICININGNDKTVHCEKLHTANSNLRSILGGDETSLLIKISQNPSL